MSSALVAGSLEAVEDQVDAEPELVAVVVAGLEDVPDGELGEVGELVRRHLRHHRLRHLGRLLFGLAHGQRGLLEREAVDVAVEERERVGRHGDRRSHRPEGSR